MPYTTTDQNGFDNFVVSEVWSVAAWATLTKALTSINFFYADDRVKALEALRTFNEAADPGGAVVNQGTRFPEEYYMSTVTNEVVDVLSAIENALSWRETNVAKDTQVHKAVASGSNKPASDETGSSDQRGFLGQSAQDSLKRYEQQMKQLRFLRVRSYWNRRKFEQTYAATWA